MKTKRAYREVYLEAAILIDRWTTWDTCRMLGLGYYSWNLK